MRTLSQLMTKLLYLMTQFSGAYIGVSQNSKTLLNMNRRNLEYIYPSNPRQFYPLADNKIITKLELTDKNIPMAETFQIYSHFYQLRQLQEDLKPYDQFVIKPASGSGGGGILVIQGRHESGFMSISGQFYSISTLHKHIADIIFGIYAFGISDQAIIEQKVEQHDVINYLSPNGLADVRVILYQQKAIQAMIRLATKKSKGTANLHQGAIGVGINLKSGKTCNASFHGNYITEHPDSGKRLIDIDIPYWPEVLKTAIAVASSVPLNYIGADIAIAQQGPCLLEINVRPGIEIQNTNAQGMRQLLEVSHV